MVVSRAIVLRFPDDAKLIVLNGSSKLIQFRIKNTTGKRTKFSIEKIKIVHKT